jgi:hypothetical protein
MNVLSWYGLKIRLRFLWPTVGEAGRVWPIRVERLNTANDFELLVRMLDRSQPMDYFLASPGDVVIRFPQWLAEQITDDLARFHCDTLTELGERVSGIDARSAAA